MASAQPPALRLPHHVLDSIRLRASILAIMVLFGLLVYIAPILLPGLVDDAFVGKLKSMAPRILPLIAAALAYETIVIALTTRWMRTGHEPNRLWAWFSQTIEITIPTLALLAFAGTLDTLSALTSATNTFYLIFILFSILRLDFALCTYAGVLAGAQYVAASLYVLHRYPPAHSDLLSQPVHHVIVGSLFAASGLVAGFVSLRIQRQIAASIKHVEDRNRIINLFGQHVSPAVVEKLLHQEVDTGGEVRHVCVMFLDIRNFTPFAENREPDEVMRYLNHLFDAMIDTVNQHKGIVNKFLGDGFMAVFGAPIDDGDNCRHAVDASIQILKLLEHMNGSGDIPPTRIGIGLHAGQAVTGNLGSQSRKEYTIIGSVVNTAARIEKLNKQFESTLLVSETVQNACQPTTPATDLGPIPIQGQQHPLRLFKLA